MSKKKPKSKNRRRKPFVTNPHRPQLGTHIDKHIHLNPLNPRPHEPGEKRGTGKPPIRIEVLNAIRYQLRANGRVFTHHHIGPKTLLHNAAHDYIHEWLGLQEGDYLEILGVEHTFTHDIPDKVVEPDPTKPFRDAVQHTILHTD